MSRSNPNEQSEKPQNPASPFFIDWDSDNKQFKYYDKEKKENIAIPLPFSFLVLDTLATIKGWSQESDSAIWSNEVKNIKTDILTIMTKKGTEAKGIYEQIKGKVSGSKYCQSVYIAFMHNKKLTIGNIQMKGAALGSWIEFCSPDKKSGNTRPNLFTGAVTVKSTEQGKVGKIVFNKPLFTYVKDVPEAVQKQTIQLDAELQAYLSKYFAYVNAFSSKEPVAEESFAAPKSNVEHWKEQGIDNKSEAAKATRSNQETQQAFEDTVTPVFDTNLEDIDELPF